MTNGLLPGLPSKALGGGTRSRRPRRNHAAGAERILVTRVGLKIPEALAYETWESAGKRLFDVVDSSVWCIGDWIAYGQTRYADRYRHAVEAGGLEYQTIRNYAWVARRFELPRRRSTLSFQHHAEVAALEPSQQDFWLDQAERFGWSRNELRRQVRGKLAVNAGNDPVSALPRISVQPERLERWRMAAERSQHTFSSWILDQLDRAASVVLDEDTRPTDVEPRSDGTTH